MNSTALKCEVIEPGVFRFAGVLDENSASVLPLDAAAGAVFDLGGLNRVSSSGAEIWLRFLRDRGLEETSATVRNIPVCFIRVLNLIPALLPPTWKIESFYVPFTGVADSAAENILFSIDRQFTLKELNLPPRVSSPVDGRQLELDVSPAKYFRFLIARFPGYKISEFGT